MSASAEFTIAGTPHSDGGYDAVESAALDLQIADAHIDIYKVAFSIVQRTKYVDGGGLTPSSGIASTPGAVVSFGVGTAETDGAPFAYRIRCIVNDGVDKSGNIVDAYTKDRIVVVRNAAGLRAQLQGEQYEYDPSFGASAIYEDYAAQLNAAKTPAFVRSTSGTPVLTVDAMNILSGTVSAASLPLAAANDRKSVWVKKHNLASIDISRSGSDKIDGANTYTMAAVYLSARFVADGANNEWLVLP